MHDHAVMQLIKQADMAISVEDFDTLMDFYAEDAVLVVQPGQIARGKPQIKAAFQATAKHFKNALTVTQGKAHVIEAGDTVLVIMETRLQTGDASEPEVRRATYVFKEDTARGWLCTIDNSYGTNLLDKD